MGKTRVFPTARPTDSPNPRQPLGLPNCLPMAQVCPLGIPPMTAGLTVGRSQVDSDGTPIRRCVLDEDNQLHDRCPLLYHHY